MSNLARQFWPSGSVTASPTGEFISQMRREGFNSLQQTFSLGMEGKGVLNELLEVGKECSIHGWDGDRAQPVHVGSISLARKFLKSLPPGSKPPTIGAEPNGLVTLEWYRSPYRVLSISVGIDGLLYYAALLGDGEARGVERFDSPTNILGLIEQVAS